MSTQLYRDLYEKQTCDNEHSCKCTWDEHPAYLSPITELCCVHGELECLDIQGRPAAEIKHGVVLVFKDHTSIHAIRDALTRMMSEGLIDRRPVDELINEYDPKWGGPVWYLP